MDYKVARPSIRSKMESLECISRTSQSFQQRWCWGTALRSKQREKGGIRETGSQAKALGYKSVW